MRMFWIVLFGLMFATGAAWADSHIRVVRLSYVTGDVQMDRATGNGFEKALLNMPVVYQSQIRTGDDGEAELEFENGSTFRLTPDTQISMADLSLTDNGEKVTRIDFDHGLAYLQWKNKDGNRFQLDVNGRTLILRKSAHLRVQSADEDLSVAVLSGDAEVNGPAGEIQIKKGETLAFDSADADRYYLAKSVETGPYDAWDKDRDDARATLARQSSNYLPADNYYGPDLGGYGNWFDSSYGTLWQPYASAGFSPYADGSWAYYPTFGWQWVSAYPWGWLPYHYGNWIFVNGHGWCWRRPQHWGHWHNITPAENLHLTGIVPPTGGHTTGVVPATGGHDIGTLGAITSFTPRPPSAPATGEGDTLISVGRGAQVPWRNPLVKGGRGLDTQAFRGDGTVDRRSPAPILTVNHNTNLPHDGALPERKVEPRPTVAPAGTGLMPHTREMTARPAPAPVTRTPEIAPRPMPAPMPHMNAPMPHASAAPAGTGTMPRMSAPAHAPAPMMHSSPSPRMSAPSTGGHANPR